MTDEPKPFHVLPFPDEESATAALALAPDGAWVEPADNCFILWVPIDD